MTKIISLAIALLIFTKSIVGAPSLIHLPRALNYEENSCSGSETGCNSQGISNYASLPCEAGSLCHQANSLRGAVEVDNTNRILVPIGYEQSPRPQQTIIDYMTETVNQYLTLVGPTESIFVTETVNQEMPVAGPTESVFVTETVNHEMPVAGPTESVFVTETVFSDVPVAGPTDSVFVTETVQQYATITMSPEILTIPGPTQFLYSTETVESVESVTLAPEILTVVQFETVTPSPEIMTVPGPTESVFLTTTIMDFETMTTELPAEVMTETLPAPAPIYLTVTSPPEILAGPTNTIFATVTRLLAEIEPTMASCVEERCHKVCESETCED